MILFGYLEYSSATFNLHILGTGLNLESFLILNPLSFIIGRLTLP